MNIFLEFITFIWVSIWVLLALIKIIKGKRNSIYIVMLVFYVFFVIPLLLDVLIGRPTYSFPGFDISSTDFETNVIYCLYISFVPVIWYLTAIRKKNNDILNINQLFDSFIKRNIFIVKLILYILLFSPVILVFFSPDPLFYTNYAAIIKGNIPDNVIKYHSIVNLSCFISVISGSVLILLKNNKNYIFLLLLILPTFLTIWIDGKRNIVAVILILYGYSLWQKEYIRKWKLITYSILAITILASFSYFYQTNLRYDKLYTNSQTVYENIRIDYGRDSVTRMTIYAELHPDVIKILDYRCESILFYTTIFIPREIWIDKPWPYAVYITSASLGIPVKSLGWGLTTSWLEEAIANFGWIGMVIGPLTISLICRVGDSKSIPIIRLLTVLVASLLLAVELTAFYSILLIWMTAVFYLNFKKHRLMIREGIMKIPAVLETRSNQIKDESV